MGEDVLSRDRGRLHSLSGGQREYLVSAVLLAVAVFYYAFLLTNGQFNLLSPERPNLGLNSMLEHLLRGEFDVDPSAMGDEGFYRDGRVYAYWGVFLALLRLPLIIIPGGMDIDITRLSALVAVSIAAHVKLRTLDIVFANTPESVAKHLIYWPMVLTILFGGPQIEFLRGSVLQEICLWGGAFAAMFVCMAVRGIAVGRFDTSSLCGMALAAGLALHTRVSIAVGLYVALGLLLLAILVGQVLQEQRSGSPGTWLGRLSLHVLSRKILLPMLILLGFAVLAGLVNYQRWGNPLVFVDFRSYIMNKFFPDRLPRMDAYGLFNLSRVPFGIVYFFFPIWVLRRSDGHLLFEEHQWRLMDSTELPPSTFFLTDPLLLLLFLYAGWSLFRLGTWHGIKRSQVLAIATGLAAPWLLMLSAIYMTFRYRIEFYPLIEFGAFVGLLLLCSAPIRELWLRRIRVLAIVSAVVGIACSHAILILYKLSEFGPAVELLRGGIVAYYLQRVQTLFPSLMP